jgi:hypothetical protein
VTVKIIRKEWKDTEDHWPRIILENYYALYLRNEVLCFGQKTPTGPHRSARRLKTGGWMIADSEDSTVYPCRMAAIVAARLTQE